jgi:hypothetical protein
MEPCVGPQTTAGISDWVKQSQVLGCVANRRSTPG